ncbi:hypothetical protein TDB9533_01255 [Thalassocella blandensis]|nr:hypothetical protein TDB9533_01255 [Thalassocella blandensis]
MRKFEHQPTEKQQIREQLEQDIETYLAAGGAVKRCPVMVATDRSQRPKKKKATKKKH